MNYFSVIPLLSVIVIILSSCSSTREEGVTIRKTKLGTIRTTVKNSWHPKSKAIINKTDDTWELKKISEGKSIVINLNRSSKLVESFDGVGYHIIAAQLPENIIIGKTYKLKPVPKNRHSKKISAWDELGNMKDGEIVAFEYANPMMSWLTEVKKASVRIVSLDAKHAVVHLVLNGKGKNLSGNVTNWDFNYDEKFTLNISTKKADNKSQ